MSRLSPQTHWLPPPRPGVVLREQAPPGLRACVVGGGIAGLAAASVLSERGVHVTLLERDAQLGGRAASFEHVLSSGERTSMERGFHGFFRQYYSLRALLRRVDPTLSRLTPLGDYPILGPGGMMQSFTDLPTRPPFQLIKLVWDTPYLGARDLLRVDKGQAMAMLRYDSEATYRRFDTMRAADYLDSLRFPERARRMLFDVFAHSFFNPEGSMSAAELLMMFHFYFTANPEGLVFDVASQPMTRAFWDPLGARLRAHGAHVHTGRCVQRIERRPQGGFIVEHDGGSQEAEMLVLALDVDGVSRLMAQSQSLCTPTLARSLGSLRRTHPFAVLRLWLDRPVYASRAPFAGTTGVGWLDNISVYDRFQDESRGWSARHAGCVLELHAYGLPEGVREAAVRDDLIAGLHTFYPETRAARIVDECLLLRRDCPAFNPGSHADRPTPQTEFPDLSLSGDYVRMPFPCALMERAAASGFMAANALLSSHAVAPEPIRSVPTRGLFSAVRWPARHTSGRPVDALA